MSLISQRSLAAGEISKDVQARTDTVKYQTGLGLLRNTYVMRHGGITNRPGTQYVLRVKDSSRAVRLIDFIFNDSNTYCLEFGHQYIRFHKNGAPILESGKTPTAITKASPGVVTSNSHGFSNGDWIKAQSIGGMTELDGRFFIVANGTTNTFELTDLDGNNVDTSGFGAFTSGGSFSRVYQLATTYDESDLFELRYTQSADVMTFTHVDYTIKELSRSSDTSWSFADYSQTVYFGPNMTQSGASGSETHFYGVTGVLAGSLKETRVNKDSAVNVPARSSLSSTSKITLTRGIPNPFYNAIEYNVYLLQDGMYFFLGVCADDGSSFAAFSDIGQEPDYERSPPVGRSVGQYGCVGIFQQRRFFGKTSSNGEYILGSELGQFSSFDYSRPFKDSDSFDFTMYGQDVSEIRHFIDLGKLVVLTSTGEWVLQGDAGGAITPTQINPKQFGYRGSSNVRPVVIGNSAIYVQARGSIIRDLAFDFNVDGYNGNDLTIFSSHLVDKFTVVDMAYQEIPHSIAYIVRSDGKMLGVTYVKSQQIIGWHQHDFGGDVKSVISIPEDNRDSVYIVVERVINGSTVKYIERMAQRNFTDIKDAIFMDSSVTVDGWNTNTSHTMTLSGGSTWEYDEELTLTSNSAYFTAEDTANEIHFEDADGNEVRFEITGYTSSTVVTGKPDKTVPASLRSTATSGWGKALTTINGLDHLEGESLSVFADGFVLGSPYNPEYNTFTVSGGSVTLDRASVKVHLGLPFISDFETLDIDTSQGEPLVDKNMTINEVFLRVDETRGLWAGPEEPAGTDKLKGLTEFKSRRNEDYDAPVALKSEVISVPIEGDFSKRGRVFVRQTEPLPFKVLSISPKGSIPMGRG